MPRRPLSVASFFMLLTASAGTVADEPGEPTAARAYVDAAQVLLSSSVRAAAATAACVDAVDPAVATDRAVSAMAGCREYFAAQDARRNAEIAFAELEARRDWPRSVRAVVDPIIKAQLVVNLDGASAERRLRDLIEAGNS